MKSSQLVIKAQDQSISAVELSKGTTGELALVDLNIMRELLNAHAMKVSLRDLKDQIMAKIDKCEKIEDYKAILSYDLAMLQLHDNLRAYDEARFEEAKKAKEKPAMMGREEFHPDAGTGWDSNSIADMVVRGQ